MAKMEKINFVFVSVYGAGKLVTKSKFIHNTKIASSRIGEDKYREKHKKNPQGRCIGLM